jgi:thioredoxin 2
MALLQLDDRGAVLPCANCGQRNRVAYERWGDKVRCATCKNELAVPAEPLEIRSSADFDRLVSRASVPVLVDYWAPWCGPCRMVAPEVAKVAMRASGKTIVLKVNTDAVADLGERFNVRSIPTLAVFVGGREVARVSGARPAADIEAFIERATAAVRS